MSNLATEKRQKDVFYYKIHDDIAMPCQGSFTRAAVPWQGSFIQAAVK